MLTHLSIQGLAIIESLNIEFASGFNVITGETGAGKSILIKALGLLLGAKSSPDSVRKGFDHAIVSGRFVLRAHHPALKLLESWGVSLEDDTNGFAVLIRRQVSVKGRSGAWLNDVPVTTASLKEMAETLIDVFGQHDNQRLFDVSFHTHYLDQFLQDKSLSDSVHSQWKKASHALVTLREFVDQARGKGRDVDYLLFRLSELDEFKPSLEDYSHASIMTERAKSSFQMSSALQKATGALEDESGEQLSKRLREVARALSAPRIADLEILATEAVKIAEALDDFSFELGRVASHIDLSEEDIDHAEARIAGYQNLFRKHHVNSAEELIAEWQKASTTAAALADASGHVQELIRMFHRDVETLLAQAKILTAARIKAAKLICGRVEQELSDLAMPGAKFSVVFEPVIRPSTPLDLHGFEGDISQAWVDVLEDWTCVGEFGSERANFYLASNAGEPSLPLARVASGGEISRIMLALKKALVVGAETCVLVFDEIDTGISGRIADTVGRKIAELAGFCQIICISHLPQVSAYADTHYIVEKRQKGERTESNIRPLGAEERLEEIARLLSGNKVTAASLAHAKSLVEEARTKSQSPKKLTSSVSRAKPPAKAQSRAREKAPAKAAARRSART